VKSKPAASARLPDFVEPMKAKLVSSKPSGGDWIYEIKFDGYRALALRGGSETQILSRNQKDLGGKFPEVKDSIAALDVQDAIIDYAASGIINTMPYPVLRRTEHGISSHEALPDAA
jgi:bifunctional non-homologous end joining protein LigD